MARTIGALNGMGCSRMGTVSVEQDGYTATTDFELVSAGQITWTAMVYKDGRLCATPSGIIGHGDYTIPDMAVRQCVRK